MKDLIGVSVELERDRAPGEFPGHWEVADDPDGPWEDAAAECGRYMRYVVDEPGTVTLLTAEELQAALAAHGIEID